MPEYTSSKSSRKMLQGPRPTPLKVQNESHKIKKQPSEPEPRGPSRQPVIIYTVSPKVIHTNPNDFMTLVQRLTGTHDPANSSPVVSSTSFQDSSAGTISPAARLTSMEKTRSPEGKKLRKDCENAVKTVQGSDTMGCFPAILSPNPATLPSNFFTSSSDQASQLGYFNDLSPVLQTKKNYLDSSFPMQSPSTFASSHGVSLDLFNNLFDL